MEYRVLLDTNIIAYLVAYGSGSPEYRIRSILARSLLNRRDVVIVLYEEQRYEIRRAVKDLIISGKLRGRRRLLVEKILDEYEKILDMLDEVGRIVYVSDTPDLVERAVDLYSMVEKHTGGRIHGKISVDLEILASAEKTEASVVTRDNLLYRYYRDILHSRVSIPSMYYLSVNQGKREATYHLCGETVKPVEDALREACMREGFKYTDPLVEC